VNPNPRSSVRRDPLAFEETGNMGVPFVQKYRIAQYVFRQKVRGNRRYPLVLRLEPLFRFNLSCVGGGKISYPEEILDRRLSVKECFSAVEECGAPVASIAGGEPLILRQDLPQNVAGLVESKKFVFLCTNGLLLKSHLQDYRSSPYLTFSIHLDGLKERHEALAAQESQVKAATSDRYPSFFAAAQGSLAGAPGQEALYNRYIPDEFNHAYVGVVAGVKWNFDFGIGKAKVDKMRAEYDKLVHTKAFAEMNIPIQVARSYQEHVEWKAAVESYQRAATASRKWTFTAMADFDMGVGTAYDMLNAVDKYGHNQARYLEALFRYNLSWGELEYAVGMKTW